MSCKYNNSMYTITPPEDEVEFDYLEQILLSEDYETQEEINKLTQKIESCWDENNPGDVRSFDERLKQKLTPEEYELITSWR